MANMNDILKKLNQLISWKNSVTSNAKRTDELDAITTPIATDLIRVYREGDDDSKAITVENLRKGLADGSIITGVYIDSTNFEDSEGNIIVVEEGKLYVDGDDWYYFDGVELLPFGGDQQEHFDQYEYQEGDIDDPSVYTHDSDFFIIKSGTEYYFAKKETVEVNIIGSRIFLPDFENKKDLGNPDYNFHGYDLWGLGQLGIDLDVGNIYDFQYWLRFVEEPKGEEFFDKYTYKEGDVNSASLYSEGYNFYLIKDPSQGFFFVFKKSLYFTLFGSRLYFPDLEMKSDIMDVGDIGSTGYVLGKIDETSTINLTDGEEYDFQYWLRWVEGSIGSSSDAKIDDPQQGEPLVYDAIDEVWKNNPNLIIEDNGEVIAPELSNAITDNAPDRVLTTKEWVKSWINSFIPNAIDQLKITEAQIKNKASTAFGTISGQRWYQALTSYIDDVTIKLVGDKLTVQDSPKLGGKDAVEYENVQADWTEVDSSSDAYIENKPQQTNYNVYNQNKANQVTVSDTNKTSVITATTGTKNVPSYNKDDSFVGSLFGVMDNQGTARNMEVFFKIGNREESQAINGSETGIVPFQIFYIINFPIAREANISGIIVVGNKTAVLDLDFQIITGLDLDVSVTLNGGQLKVNSSYLHRNYNG